MTAQHQLGVESDQTRFTEIISFAQTMCGAEAGERASLTELAAELRVSPSIVNRYRSGAVHFGNLKAETVRRLAEVCRVQPGTLYVWMRDGRAAAEVYERQVSTGMRTEEPSALALAEMLVEQLRQQQPLHQAEPELRYDMLQAVIEEAAADGGSFWQRLVTLLKAEPVLERVQQHEELSDDDWTTLRQLLATDDPAFIQRFYAAA